MSVDWDDTSGATSYSVRWQAAGPGSSPKLGVEAQSSNASITVADYGEWVVQVGACNSVGCGPIAAQRFTVSPTGVERLPVPLTLIARELVRGEVTLSWPARADDGGFAITGYNIVREHTPAGSSSTVTDAIAADTGLTAIAKDAESEDGTTYTYYEYVDADVEEETSYTYYVRAITSEGTGDAEQAVIETLLQTEGVPREPENLSAREAVRGQVTLSWTAPADDGGFAITGYSIAREHTPAGSSSPVIETVAADTGITAIARDAESDDGTTYTYYEYVDTDVEQETNYTYYLRAINSAGTGDDEYISIETWLPPEESSEAPSADSLTQIDSPIIAWIN